MTEPNLDSKFDTVIPTAILTAYPRTFSNIPYSQEIFNEMKRMVGNIDKDQLVTRIAPELEARSKIIDRHIKEQGATQILELAAGFSSRGISLAEDENLVYVEIDLPEVAERKRQILHKIATIPANLRINAGNVLRKTDFQHASDIFDDNKTVTIVNEGLLRYLSFEEKAVLAGYIKRLLEKHGGAWISGDGATREFRNSQHITIGATNTTIFAQTKSATTGDAFQSQDHFRTFFEALGFTVEFHDYTEVQDILSSPQKLGLSEDVVRDKLLSYASAVVFRLKDK